jgi:hypothetical protein
MTGDSQYQAKLFEWFPDPTDPATFRWGWQRMGVCYGNTIRDYAFALSSGRLAAGQIQQDYLAKCINVITNCGNDVLSWSQDNAYGTSFPDLTKAYRSGGWYFSPEQAFDMVVAYQFNANALYIDALLRNMNYEGGCNPVNVSYLTGIGWKRPHNVVDQYSLNDGRSWPKDGVPVSNIQSGFLPVWTYGWELGALVYPSDYIDTATYPYYDRWCDDWNVSTEGSTTDTARSFASTAWLAAQTSLAGQTWRSTNATIIVPATAVFKGQPLTVTLNSADTNLSAARIVWEVIGQEPVFGSQNYTFIPGAQAGAYRVEAEVQWPDGRRTFAANSVSVSADAPPQLTNPRSLTVGGFSFTLTGSPLTRYEIQVSTDLATWSALATNVVSGSTAVTVTDAQAGSFSQRYYRALPLP